ncbi:type II toxin-antitoxin system RelB/DinJ family antitoxin [Bartonella machadoae]|uniref:type II toxin-antitoxin system RelB/DinJ family antitoxin n=1 Tax=Bartonella machadoae TaxID=2893471 RepID=UPI001F4CF36B|nr:type II toxin-antitoxin system RelB/DinJ family antitoxin [Bartonella machadoae]UNE53888.1 type II toxin-antitoxin system RelB/DinJ family antitoxin [Bartonella machadoae]
MSVAVDSKEVIRVRIDKNLKKETHEILATLGVTVFDFIRIALTKVINERGLPFDMYVLMRKRLRLLKKLIGAKMFFMQKMWRICLSNGGFHYAFGKLFW